MSCYTKWCGNCKKATTHEKGRGCVVCDDKRIKYATALNKFDFNILTKKQLKALIEKIKTYR